MSTLSCTHVCRAACLPKVFCVQRMVGMKIQAIKSWVLHVNYALALNRSKASAQLPGKERSPMEWGYTTALYNPCAEALVSPLWHKHTLLGRHTFASACSFCSGRTWVLKVCQLLMEICCKWGGLKGCFHLQSTINSLLSPDVVRYDINTLWRPHIGVALQMASFGFKYFAPGLYQ